MKIALAASAAPTSTAASRAIATAKQMEGVLWYEMLSELNKNGLDVSALGAGGGAFQDSFLWNIAQNDFTKYDTGLTTATIKQIGGRAATAPVASETMASTDGLGTAALAASGAAPDAVPAAVTTSPLPAPDGNLIDQATNFAKTVWPGIVSAAASLGVPPVAVLAQTALETGWGAAAAGHNLFGIKALNGAAGTARPTHEMVGGVLQAQTAMFQDYASTGASISSYVGQIKSGFQNVVGQNSITGFAQALQDGGYATDSDYATKIINIAQSPLMTQVLQALGKVSTAQ